jgi:hypothetical protein
MLRNDVKSAPQAADLMAGSGGPAQWAELTGSVPAMSFTVTELRWLAETEPEHAARTARVLLPDDWLSWRLTSGGAWTEGGDPAVLVVTDRGRDRPVPTAGLRASRVLDVTARPLGVDTAGLSDLALRAAPGTFRGGTAPLP